MKRLIVLVAVLVALAAQVAGAQAAPRQRCFAETGFCAAGPILEYWERNGGLAVFGYPISAQRDETIEFSWTGPVQWFERDRLEDHGNEGKGVLAGRLGARVLELRGTPWVPGNDGPQPGRNLCMKFEQTGYNVCAPFSGYWQQNGGLARFGYPISPVRQEMIEGKAYSVQYFERRRLEYHPENAGTPFEIQLGLLGRDIYPACLDLNDGALLLAVNRLRAELGCPSLDARELLPAATQTYERGWMVWIDATVSAPPLIYALTLDPSGTGYRWQAFTDTYREGEAIGGGDTPPAGLIAPARGFGKLWWSNPELRAALGWATSTEQPDTGSAVFYNNGAWLVHAASAQQLFVMRPGGAASVE